MRTRKLLILTMYFPPCAAIASQRMIGLVRYLPNYNWNTIVIAPPHVHDEPNDPNLIKLISSETNTLYTVPFIDGFLGKVNRKFFPDYLWMLQARIAYRKAILQHQPDIVLTSFPPMCVHKLGIWMKKTFNLPWIADFRDPCFIPGIHANHEGKKKLGGEKKILKLADIVVSTSPTYTQRLKSAYPFAINKINTIFNGYDPDNFQFNLSPPPRERLSLLYTGELYSNRNPLGLLDALAQLESSPTSNMPKVGFHFIGRSNFEYDLVKEVRARGLEDIVKIEGIKPYHECLQDTAQADILVLIQTEGQTATVPAKLYEYIGAKRPILALANPPGDIEWVLKNSGVLYRIAPVRDVNKIKQAIIELVFELSKNNSTIIDRPDLITFTREYMVQQFAELLNGML